MALSHRDLRAHREVARLLVAVGGTIVALFGVALGAPLPALGALAVLGLAALGAFAMARGNALVRKYEHDLRAPAREGDDRLGAIGVEVRSAVSLEPPAPSPTRRSPHVRPPGRRGTSPELRGPRPDPAT